MKKFLLAAALMATAPASAATMLQNGGFEATPSLAGWSQSSSGVVGETDGGAYEGGSYAIFDNTPGNRLYQDVVLHQGRYELRFAYNASNGGVPTDGLVYHMAGIGGTIFSGTSVRAGEGGWMEVVREFYVASEQKVRLSFAAIGSGDNRGGYLDAVGVMPVPLPAAGGMLLLAGLGGAAIARRRKRS